MQAGERISSDPRRMSPRSPSTCSDSRSSSRGHPLMCPSRDIHASMSAANQQKFIDYTSSDVDVVLYAAHSSSDKLRRKRVSSNSATD